MFIPGCKYAIVQMGECLWVKYYICQYKHGNREPGFTSQETVNASPRTVFVYLPWQITAFRCNKKVQKEAATSMGLKVMCHWGSLTSSKCLKSKGVWDLIINRIQSGAGRKAVSRGSTGPSTMVSDYREWNCTHQCLASTRRLFVRLWRRRHSEEAPEFLLSVTGVSLLVRRKVCVRYKAGYRGKADVPSIPDSPSNNV